MDLTRAGNPGVVPTSSLCLHCTKLSSGASSSPTVLTPGILKYLQLSTPQQSVQRAPTSAGSILWVKRPHPAPQRSHGPQPSGTPAASKHPRADRPPYLPTPKPSFDIETKRICLTPAGPQYACLRLHARLLAASTDSTDTRLARSDTLRTVQDASLDLLSDAHPRSQT